HCSMHRLQHLFARNPFARPQRQALLNGPIKLTQIGDVRIWAKVAVLRGLLKPPAKQIERGTTLFPSAADGAHCILAALGAAVNLPSASNWLQSARLETCFARRPFQGEYLGWGFASARPCKVGERRGT